MEGCIDIPPYITCPHIAVWGYGALISPHDPRTSILRGGYNYSVIGMWVSEYLYYSHMTHTTSACVTAIIIMNIAIDIH